VIFNEANSQTFALTKFLLSVGLVSKP
jgi:hypothetical protein